MLPNLPVQNQGTAQARRTAPARPRLLAALERRQRRGGRPHHERGDDDDQDQVVTIVEGRDLASNRMPCQDLSVNTRRAAILVPVSAALISLVVCVVGVLWIGSAVLEPMQEYGPSACTVYATARMQQLNGAMTPEEAEPQLRRAVQLARKAAAQDTKWRRLVPALQDMLSASDPSMRAAADQRAWDICGAWVGT